MKRLNESEPGKLRAPEPAAIQAEPAIAPSTNAFGCAEDERLRVVASFGMEALEDDVELARIVRFAAQLCDAPLAMVSIVEDEHQHFLVREGLDERSTPREVSFCAQAIGVPGVTVVPDATDDPRFAHFPHVAGDPGIRFYAGQTLVSEENAALGTLCVLDLETRPDGLSELQRNGLEVLAAAVMRRLEARRERLAARIALEGSEAHTRRLIDLMPQIAFSVDPDGRFGFFNERYFAFTDHAPPPNAEAWRELIHADDHDPTCRAWYDAVEKGEAFYGEFRLRDRDGNWRWMLSRVNPVGEPVGGAYHWFGTLTDIHDTHQESENRDLLARELSHRIKNIFAVVSSLVSIRSRGKPEIRDFADDLTQTIGALGRAHDYVRPLEGRKGDSLHGLFADLLAPYRNGSGSRIVVTGDESPIGARAATPLALVVHELATNSAKYGALSVADGTVSIAIAPADRDKSLSIVWQEDSDVDMPEAGPEGFGSRLVKLAVEGQLNGSIERTFAPRGLRAEVVVSIAALAS